MAIYKKKGKKAQEVKQGESTTKEVFNALDIGASRSEAFIQKNQKYIVSIIALIIIGSASYMAYDRYVIQPLENEAIKEAFFSQKNFEAGAEKSDDSILKIALEGDEANMGLNNLIEKYASTNTGNLSFLKTGIIHIQLNNYKSAIEVLKDFSSENNILMPIALGLIGDAYSELEDYENALTFYKKAYNDNTNEFTTPHYMFKYAKVLITLEKNDDAKIILEKINEDYLTFFSANNIETILHSLK